jgi:hypothetical protein
MHLIQIEPAMSVAPFSTDLALAKEQLKDVVKQLNKAEVKPDLDTRLFVTDLVIEEYVHATQVRPDDYQLYALGSYLLDDYLTDQYKKSRKKSDGTPEENHFQTEARVKKNHARNRTIFLGDRTDVKAT